MALGGACCGGARSDGDLGPARGGGARIRSRARRDAVAAVARVRARTRRGGGGVWRGGDVNARAACVADGGGDGALDSARGGTELAR